MIPFPQLFTLSVSLMFVFVGPVRPARCGVHRPCQHLVVRNIGKGSGKQMLHRSEQSPWCFTHMCGYAFLEGLAGLPAYRDVASAQSLISFLSDRKFVRRRRPCGCTCKPQLRSSRPGLPVVLGLTDEDIGRLQSVVVAASRWCCCSSSLAPAPSSVDQARTSLSVEVVPQ